MLVVKVEGIDELTAGLNDMAREQVPFATALALTRTARKAKGMLYAEMRSKLDRPSPFTVPPPQFDEKDNMGSMRVEQATKARMYAEVKMKDWPASKQRVATDPLLRHHFFGGARVAKGMELWFREVGLLRANEYLTIGDGAKRNRYGNIDRGVWETVKSQLKLQVSGSEHRASDSRRSKKSQGAAGRIFWSYGPGGPGKLIDLETGIEYGSYTKSEYGRKNNLPKGVWVRKGGELSCLLKAVEKAPTYRQLFDLQKIAADAVQMHFRAEFKGALRDAIKHSGYKGKWKR